MRRACRSGDASGPVRSLSRDRLHQPRQRGDGGARRGGIGGVGFDQQRRALAAQQFAREIHGNVEHELHLALRERAAAGFFVGQCRRRCRNNRSSPSPPRSCARTRSGRRRCTAVGRCFGSVLIAKPNSVSCTIGMPTIMPNVTRSRRSWMNSLRTMLHQRVSEKQRARLRS